MGFFNNVSPQALENVQEFDAEKYFKVGENPAFIRFAYESKSKTGKDMLVIEFENDKGGEIKAYIAEGEFKLKSLKNLMSSFGIVFSNYNLTSWIGKRGVVVCKEGEPYNGKTYPKVSYFRSLKSGTDGKPEEPFPDKIPF